ncbi:protein TBATA [Marmota marmota marmota]|uniref:protein TBATA n=1 Tax=Marmota marmota marmota TaxID=9994 RepID=UPI0007629C35|nr:protein TBATA [Marmota marmota marmota]
MATEVRSLDEQPLSPKAELNLEKKPRHWPQSLGDSGPQKESVVPGIVDLELTREKMRSPKAMPSGTYRFGRLSHPHHVTHVPGPRPPACPSPALTGYELEDDVFEVLRIKQTQGLLPWSWHLEGKGSEADFTGRPVCIVRNKLSASPLPRSSILSQCLKVIPSISVPIGDPQSNRNPQLSYEAWKKELKELTSRVVMFTKETEQNNKEQKEEPLREQGARYSAETGRLIPASAQALNRHGSQQGQRSHLSSRDRGVQTSVLQNQELLILELLCQILQTDSLSAVQYWLLYATPTEKELALALLQRAVSQLLPQPSASPPAERLLNQPQQIQEAPQEKPHSPSRWAPHLPFRSQNCFLSLSSWPPG